MPGDLPTYQPRVAPEAPAARVGEQMVPGAAGWDQSRAQGVQAAAGSFGEMGELAAQQEYYANQVVDEKARTQGEQALTDVLYGTHNQDGSLARKGLAQYEGLDAAKGAQDLRQQLSDSLDQIQQGLPNPRARLQFGRGVPGILKAFDQRSLEHVNSEYTKYDQAVTQEAVDTYTMQGVLNAKDALVKGGQVEKAHMNLLNATAQSGERMGLSPEDPRFKNRIAQVNSAFHSAIVNQLLTDKQPGLARQYFKEHEAEMVPKFAQKVDKGIQVGQDRAESEDLAQRAIAAGLGKMSGVDDYLDGYKGDPEVARRARRIASEQLRQQQEDETQDEMDALKQAAGERGGKPGSIIDFLPPEVAANLSAKGRKAAEGYDRPGLTQKSERPAWNKFDAWQKDGLDKVSEADLWALHGKVHQASWNYMKEAWQEAHEQPGMGPAGQRLKDYTDAVNQVNRNVPDTGLDVEGEVAASPAFKDPKASQADKDKAIQDVSRKALKKRTRQPGGGAPARWNVDWEPFGNLSPEFQSGLLKKAGISGKPNARQADLLARAAAKFTSKNPTDLDLAKALVLEARDAR